MPQVTKTWIGGGDNNATNPADWSPAGVPQTGDTLLIHAGSINVTDNDLAGNPLIISATGAQPPSIDLIDADVSLMAQGTATTPGVNFTINADGSDTVNFLQPTAQYINPIINIAPNANIALSGSLNFFTYTVEGVGGTLLNNGTLHYFSGAARILTNLDGTGEVDVTRAHDGPGILEMNGSVGANQTFALSANTFDASLKLDTPSQFNGLIDVKTITDGGAAIINLQLVHAASYTFANNTFTLYDSSGKVVDSLRMTNETTAKLSVSQTSSGVVVDFGSKPSGTLLPVYTPPQPNHFRVADLTTGTVTDVPGSPYSGPVQGIDWQFIDITPDKLDITALSPNVFIHSGSSDDAIDVSQVGGTNVMDGSTGSNYLTGGSGTDQFFVDDRNPGADIWTTIANFHSGDSATIWGITPQDFKITPADNVLPTSPGLDFQVTGGAHNANLTIRGYSTQDLQSGKLSVSYGRTPDMPRLPGSNYMLIQAS